MSSSCEWHGLHSSPQLGDNMRTFSSLTVPSAVNSSTERTHVSWKWFLDEPKWICSLNWTFVQICPSMLAAANVKENEKINMLSFICVQKHCPKSHRTMTATHCCNNLKMDIYLSLGRVCPSIGCNPKGDMEWLKWLIKYCRNLKSFCNRDINL